jgi:2-dehydropantoate 2-reductase
LEEKTWLADFNRLLTTRLIDLKSRRIKPSSLQSIERGRRTEMDFLNGCICEGGREQGVPTPLNDAVREMVHEIEDGNRQTALGTIEESVFVW